MLTPDVERAVEKVRRAFPDHAVEVLEDGAGGACVLVEDCLLGPAFVPDSSWVAFAIPYQYPRADVYPHFVRPDLARADGAALSSPLNAGHTVPLFNRPALMVSRRSQRWNPSRDSALLKLLRVLLWFDQQAPSERKAV